MAKEKGEKGNGTDVKGERERAKEGGRGNASRKKGERNGE